MTSIGGDWVEHVDPATNKKYYVNTSTSESTWSWPSEIPKPNDSDGDSDDDDGGGDEWEEKLDPSSGRNYYYNPKTGETSWTKPGAKLEGGAQWTKKHDDSSGRDYYVNLVTFETTWEKPKGFDDGSSGGGNEKEESEKAAKSAKEDKFAKIKALKGGGAAKAAKKPEKKPASSAVDDGNDKGNGDDDDEGTVMSLTEVDVGVVEEALMETWAKPKEEGGMGRFNLDRKGMFGKRTEVAKILRFKSDLIKTALLKLNSSMNLEAVQAFKNIVSFMGDRSTKKEMGGHAQKLMKNTLHAPEELRDEIFCQLIKQTTQNPSVDSIVKGWQLMAIASSTYPPSKDFHPYLMWYCETHKSDGDGVGDLATSVQKRVHRTMIQGARTNVPTDVEIEAVKDGKPVILRVYLLNGEYIVVAVHSWTTIKELHAMVARKKGCKSADAFSIYEVSSADEERVLEDDDRVLDIVAYWQKTFDDDKAKSKGKGGDTYHFLFKVRLFIDFEADDFASVDIFYIQGVHDVVNSRYPTNEQDCVTLAALQMQERYGDFANNPELITGELGSYIPKKLLESKAREQEMEDMVLKVWKTLAGKGYTSRDAKSNYLDYVKSWKIYGSTYFVVEPQNSREYPKEVVMAINAQRILLVHPQTQEFLAEFPYSEVVTWGQSSKSFVLVTGNVAKQTKIYFRTEQGKDMNSLVHSYVNKIIGK